MSAYDKEIRKLKTVDPYSLPPDRGEMLFYHLRRLKEGGRQPSLQARNCIDCFIRDATPAKITSKIPPTVEETVAWFKDEWLPLERKIYYTDITAASVYKKLEVYLSKLPERYKEEPALQTAYRRLQSYKRELRVEKAFG